jgi:hypothetical protein
MEGGKVIEEVAHRGDTERLAHGREHPEAESDPQTTASGTQESHEGAHDQSGVEIAADVAPHDRQKRRGSSGVQCENGPEAVGEDGLGQALNREGDVGEGARVGSDVGVGEVVDEGHERGRTEECADDCSLGQLRGHGPPTLREGEESYSGPQRDEKAVEVGDLGKSGHDGESQRHRQEAPAVAAGRQRGLPRPLDAQQRQREERDGVGRGVFEPGQVPQSPKATPPAVEAARPRSNCRRRK